MTSPWSACRFLPHGNFDKKVKLIVPYEAGLLPSGFRDDDIASFFYDETTLQWSPLAKVHVEKGTQVVVSETSHFTDVIDGILVLPDHPSPLSFNPNSIKDLKAASPAAGIDLIEPPQGSVDGNANLGFAIDVPPGRGGATPSLGVHYSSGAGDGPMGMGWNLSTSRISVDTRFGVPRYTGDELYTLDGRQLEATDDAGSGGCRRYRERIEGSFLQINRCGTGVADYRWEIVSKDGSKAVYGERATTRLADPGAAHAIFEWLIERTTDPNGNIVEYAYRQDSLALAIATPPSHVLFPDTTRLGNEPWVAAYLSGIRYSGHVSGEAGRYSISISYDDGSRPDLVLDGRAGFKMLWRLRPTAVAVKLDNTLIRSYAFKYKIGNFSKTLLESVALSAGDGSEFYRHTFEYEKAPADSSGVFAPFAPVARYENAEVTRPLSFTDEASFGESLYLGAGPIVPCNRSESLGFRIGHDEGSSSGVEQIADINGDGLPDEILDGSVRYNRGPGAGFSNGAGDTNLHPLEYSEQQSWSVALEGQLHSQGVGGSITASANWSFNKSNRTLVDFNGDGFLDVLSAGTLFRNTPSPDGNAHFEADPGLADPGAFETADPETQAELKSRIFLVDPVSRWRAPFDGTVTIAGAARRLDPVSHGDGTAVFVHDNSGAVVWSAVLPPDTNDPQTPSGSGGAPLTLSVRAGDSIYFRVSARDDVKADAVSWSPTVTYSLVCVARPDGTPSCSLVGPGLLGSNATARDLWNRPVYSFSRGPDFSFDGAPPGGFGPPYEGDIRITGTIQKQTTTHPVTVTIYRGGGIFRRFDLTPEAVGSTAVDITVPDVKPASGDEDHPPDAIRFEIASKGDTTGRVQFEPTIAYQTICQRQIPSGALECTDVSASSFHGIPLAGHPQLSGAPRYVFTAAAHGEIGRWSPAVPQKGVALPVMGRVKITGRVSQSSPVQAPVSLGVFLRNHRLFDADGVITPPQSSTAFLGNVDLAVEADVDAGDMVFLRAETSGAVPDDTFGSSETKVEYTQVCTLDTAGNRHCLPADPGHNAPATAALPLQTFWPETSAQGVFAGGAANWWVAGWNGNRPFSPIRFTQATDADNDGPYGITFARLAATSTTAAAWAAGDARIEAARIVPARATNSASSTFGVASTIRKGQSSAKGLAFGAALLPGVSIGASISQTKTSSTLDLFDFNGDRIPDQIARDKVRYLRKDGSEVETRSLPFGNVRSSHGETISVNLGGSIPTSRPNSKGRPNNPDPGKSNGTGGISITPELGVLYGFDQADTDFVDVNGDGLPDRVARSTSSGALHVQLNLGYRFGVEEIWNAGTFGGHLAQDPFHPPEQVPLPDSPDALRVENQIAMSSGIGVDASVIGGGVHVTYSGTRTYTDLIDVNGDGLPDIVFKDPEDSRFQVRLNEGGKFAPATPWAIPAEWGVDVGTYLDNLVRTLGIAKSWGLGDDPFKHVEGLRYSSNLSASIDAFANITIPLPFAGVCLFIGPGASAEQASGGVEISLQDLDGDGLPDYIFKGREGFSGETALTTDTGIRWKRNTVGPTNLLKKVTRPLGGSFSIAYERAEHTIKNPSGQWTLAQVELKDGFSNTYKTDYSYANGVYDRTEREFLGFGTVLTRDSVGREVEEVFDVSSYFHQGLLLSTTVRSEATANALAVIPHLPHAQPNLPIWTKSENTYLDRVLPEVTGEPPAVFPQRVQTVRSFYEGSASAQKSLAEKFSFDEFGNMSAFDELGEPGAADDLHAEIHYASLGGYRIGLPDRLTVTGSDGTVLRERRASYDANGNVIALTSTVTGGTNPTSHLEWDSFGNLTHFTDPVGYTVDYTYETDVHHYVTSVRDSFGYSSSATYDLRFGLPLKNTDLNNNRTSYVYDAFGRTTSIFGPKEFGGSTPAFAMSYFLGTAAERPWALTKNKEDLVGAGTLDTLTVIDGLERVVQVQTEAEVGTSTGGKQHGVIVSGAVTYDGAGRVTSQEQPAFVTGFPNSFVNASGDRPTHFLFDPLDRTTRVTLPDDSVTQTAYDFAESLHRTTVIDAENRRRVSLSDVRGNVLAIDEILGSQAIRTKYRYDALSQLTLVTDAKGNKTRISYDSLGRRTRFFNPDRGQIDYSYDPSGNLTTLVDDNLRAANQSIRYLYEFDRLKAVEYPSSPKVVYEYGPPSAPHNQAGRIAKITDESGFETREYGNLGELTKSTRAIASFTGPAISGTYSTLWSYDTFGRMRDMTYPDGELLTYAYDQGGRVVSATGKKNGHTVHYLDDVVYDEFGSRVRLELGNGVVSTYSYDPNRRFLTFLHTENPQGEVLQALQYTYDHVGNILQLADTGIHPGVQTFLYDTLDRLTNAQGEAKLKNGAESRYTNTFSYDVIHNLEQKVQHHDVVQNGGAINPQQKTTYTLNVAYGGPKPHALTTDGEKTYQHDPNGNMLGWQSLHDGTRRDIAWDEENRIKNIRDNGNQIDFLYDAGGQRVVKRGQYGEVATVNAFFTAKNAEVFTKHVFVGSTRIASEVVKKGSGGGTGISSASPTTGTLVASADPGVAPAPPPADAGNAGHDNGNGKDRGNGHAYGSSGDHGNGGNNGNSQNSAPAVQGNGGGDPWSGPEGAGRETGLTHGNGRKVGLHNQDGSTPPPPPGGGNGGSGAGSNGSGHGGAGEERIFFYHPDHLGSTSYLTDGTGRVFERLAYFPFGEVWIDEGTDPGETLTFKFTGKELDPETDLYLVGARYLDPRIGGWLSSDPNLQPDVGRSKNLSSVLPGSLAAFTYANSNPLKFVDADGKEPNRAQATTWSGARSIIDSFTPANKQPVSLQTLRYTEKRVTGVQIGPFGGDQKPRYIWTEQFGWIDLGHFFQVAAKTESHVGNGVFRAWVSTPYIPDISLYGGRPFIEGALLYETRDVENGQKGESRWSYEDASSNQAGLTFFLDFYRGPSSKSDLLEDLDAFFKASGAKSPADAPNWKTMQRTHQTKQRFEESSHWDLAPVLDPKLRPEPKNEKD